MLDAVPDLINLPIQPFVKIDEKIKHPHCENKKYMNHEERETQLLVIVSITLFLSSFS